MRGFVRFQSFDFENTQQPAKVMTFQNNGIVNNFGQILGANGDSYQTKSVDANWTSEWYGNDFEITD